MTKGKLLPWSTKMNVSEVKKSVKMWQGEEGDMISPCKEKVLQILGCCQDVAEQLDCLQSRLLQSNRIQEMPSEAEMNCAMLEIPHLQDELRSSRTRIKELETKETSLRRKVAEMEEKVQALTAQLMVYKEDFDLERRDREHAQGRIAQLEQQLLLCKLPREPHSFWPSLEQNSHVHQFAGHPRHNHSTELVARSRDVCDVFETDSVVDVVDNMQSEAVVAAPVVKEDAAAIYLLAQNPERCASVELLAQSFDIQDFFPVIPSPECKVVKGIPALRRQEVAVLDNEDVAKKGELCADEIRSSVQSTRPEPNLVSHDTPMQESYLANSWSFLSLATTNYDGVQRGNLNFNCAESPCLLGEKEQENSTLQCPKCHKSYFLRDHFLLLEHLEEC